MTTETPAVRKTRTTLADGRELSSVHWDSWPDGTLGEGLEVDVFPGIGRCYAFCSLLAHVLVAPVGCEVGQLAGETCKVDHAGSYSGPSTSISTRAQAVACPSPRLRTGKTCTVATARASSVRTVSPHRARTASTHASASGAWAATARP